MKKNLFSLFCVLTIMVMAGNAHAGINTYTSTASFGSGANCSGRGICSSCSDAGIATIYTYDTRANVFTITFNPTDMGKDGAANFTGQKTYTFDKDWAAPDVLNKAMGTSIVVKGGVAYPLSFTTAGCTITITLGS